MRQNLQMGILGGKGEAVFETNEPIWFKQFQENFAVGDQSASIDDLSKVDEVYGAGFAIRRSFLMTLKSLGLKSLLTGRTGTNVTSGEDTELCFFAAAVGVEVWYNRKLQFKHFMASSRMKWSYMKKLYAGFGKANIYTHAYKYVQQYNRVPGANLKYSFWLDTYIHKIKQLLRFYPSIMFRMNREGDATVLRFIAIRAEAKEIWDLKEKYSDLYRTIYFYLNKDSK